MFKKENNMEVMNFRLHTFYLLKRTISKKFWICKLQNISLLLVGVEKLFIIATIHKAVKTL